MADAEAEQEARAVGPPLGLDRREEVVDRLLLPSFAAEQLGAVIAKAEDVGGRVQPAEFDELGNALFAEALDVERAATDEMPQALEALGGADQAARAADVDLAFLGDRFGIAHRAARREFVGWARLVARQILDHLRDHVAGALDSDAVADAQAQARDLVAVVEGDVGDDHAADADRRQRPTGVSLPVRPTWMSIASSVVSAFSAGNLCARPQRGARATKPSRSCRSSRSTL